MIWDIHDLLSQANAETNVTDRFREDRSRTQALRDEAALVAAVVCADVNPTEFRERAVRILREQHDQYDS